MTILERLVTAGGEVTGEVSRRARLAARGHEAGAPVRTAIVAAGSAAAGALAAFLLDPARGRARRARLADQAAAAARRGLREAERLGRRVSSDLRGKATAMRHANAEGDPFPDDVTLTAKVQTELFRDPGVPKGSINVNVERGVVVLRGEVPDDRMRAAIVSRVERMTGVWAVRNLLHLPGETAEPEAVASA